MYIIAQFNNDNVPETGLTPNISIRDVESGSLTVATTTMDDIENGFYSYNFTIAARNKNYTVLCDGGSTLDSPERFTSQIIEVDGQRAVDEK